jgi:multiple sugar transport system substrate-binding protein
MFETTPGYYQNFTWYPFMWQGGGEFQTADGKSGFDSPATVAALKLWQDAVNSGAAPRQMLGGGGGDIVANLGSGYCAMQNVGIWGISAMDNNAPDVPYGIFKLPVPAGGKYVTVGGGWAFVANAKGKNPEGAAQFIAWALASMQPDSIQRVVDWCTVAKSDMPPRDSALEMGAEAFNKGNLAVFAKEIHPGTRAEPRVPPEVYKIISDAIQATQLGGADPQATATAASQQLDAFLAGYTGAPIL